MTPNSDSSATHFLKEGAVGFLEDERVGCSNFFNAEYQLADGEQKEGLTAMLSLFSTDKNIRVGAGSVFEAGDVSWRVVEVKEPGDKGGRVLLVKN